MAEMIVPPNPMLAKVGRFGIGPDAVAKAEAALAQMADQFDTWMDAELLGLNEARRTLERDSGPSSVRALFKSAHDLKGLGTTYGYPLVTRTAASLSRLIDLKDASNPQAWAPLMSAHVDAINAIVRGRHKAADDPVGLVLAGELEQRVSQVR